jgi:hypothetical protein
MREGTRFPNLAILENLASFTFIIIKKGENRGGKCHDKTMRVENLAEMMILASDHL